jgi:hypothetical protein
VLCSPLVLCRAQVLCWSLCCAVLCFVAALWCCAVLCGIVNKLISFVFRRFASVCFDVLCSALLFFALLRLAPVLRSGADLCCLVLRCYDVAPRCYAKTDDQPAQLDNIALLSTFLHCVNGFIPKSLGRTYCFSALMCLAYKGGQELFVDFP